MSNATSSHTNPGVPPIPKATIYLRDRFSIVPGKKTEFTEGKMQLLLHARNEWKLVAGAGAQPFLRDRNSVAPQFPLMHIWRFAHWRTLYQSMYYFTDTSWYARLQDALAYESQDLLVGVHAYPTSKRPQWKVTQDVDGSMNGRPTHTYLYEEILLRKELSAHTFLRDACWFADEVTMSGKAPWGLTWCALQVTGRPNLLCVLWSVPSVQDAVGMLDYMANESTTRDRYQRMLSYTESITREYMYPNYVEFLDQQMRVGKPVEVPRSVDMTQ